VVDASAANGQGPRFKVVEMMKLIQSGVAGSNGCAVTDIALPCKACPLLNLHKRIAQ
jgi:hypothetical protein